MVHHPVVDNAVFGVIAHHHRAEDMCLGVRRNWSKFDVLDGQRPEQVREDALEVADTPVGVVAEVVEHRDGNGGVVRRRFHAVVVTGQVFEDEPEFHRLAPAARFGPKFRPVP